MAGWHCGEVLSDPTINPPLQLPVESSLVCGASRGVQIFGVQERCFVHFHCAPYAGSLAVDGVVHCCHLGAFMSLEQPPGCIR